METKSEQAKEGNRRRVAKSREKKKREQMLSDTVKTAINPPTALSNFATQVGNRVVNRAANTTVNSVFQAFQQNKGTIGLADGESILKTVGKTLFFTVMGAGTGLLCGEGIRWVVWGNKASDEVKALYRAGGLLAGGALGAGGYIAKKLLFTPAAEPSVADNEDVPQAVTLAMLENRVFEKVLLTPEFKEFFGNHAEKHDVCIVYGTAGHGKSTFATKFANSLNQFGSSLYISTEELPDSEKVRGRLIRLGARNLPVVRCVTVPQIMRAISYYQPKYLVIDSLTKLNLSQNDELELLELLRMKADFLIVTLHVNKDKSYKGSSSLIHAGDVEVSVEDGIATSRKNRLGRTAHTMDLGFNQDKPQIFPINSITKM